MSNSSLFGSTAQEDPFKSTVDQETQKQIEILSLQKDHYHLLLRDTKDEEYEKFLGLFFLEEALQTLIDCKFSIYGETILPRDGISSYFWRDIVNCLRQVGQWNDIPENDGCYYALVNPYFELPNASSN